MLSDGLFPLCSGAAADSRPAARQAADEGNEPTTPDGETLHFTSLLLVGVCVCVLSLCSPSGWFFLELDYNTDFTAQRSVDAHPGRDERSGGGTRVGSEPPHRNQQGVFVF